MSTVNLNAVFFFLQLQEQENRRAKRKNAAGGTAPRKRAAATAVVEDEAQLKCRQNSEAQRKQAEETKRKQAEELKRVEEAKLKQQAEELKRKEAQEAQRKADEAQRKLAEDARRKQAEEDRLKQAEEAKTKTEEEANRKKAQEEAKRLEIEAKTKAEAETKVKAEQETARKAEEAAKHKAADQAKAEANKATQDVEAKTKAEAEAIRTANEAAKLKVAEKAKVDEVAEAAQQKTAVQAKADAAKQAAEKGEGEEQQDDEMEPMEIDNQPLSGLRHSGILNSIQRDRSAAAHRNPTSFPVAVPGGERDPFEVAGGKKKDQDDSDAAEPPIARPVAHGVGLGMPKFDPLAAKKTLRSSTDGGAAAPAPGVPSAAAELKKSGSKSSDIGGVTNMYRSSPIVASKPAGGAFVPQPKQLQHIDVDKVIAYDRLKNDNRDALALEGVDLHTLEAYLSPEEFKSVFKATKPEFYKMAAWKQEKLKKEAGLF